MCILSAVSNVAMVRVQVWKMKSAATLEQNKKYIYKKITGLLLFQIKN